MARTEPDPPLLDRARRVERDYCWPIDDARSVIDALSASGLAVLGVELWTFRHQDDKPTVEGWSDYDLDLEEGSWSSVVAASATAAGDALGRAPDEGDLWVQVSWIGESQARSGPR